MHFHLYGRMTAPRAAFRHFPALLFTSRSVIPESILSWASWGEGSAGGGSLVPKVLQFLSRHRGLALAWKVHTPWASCHLCACLVLHAAPQQLRHGHQRAACLDLDLPCAQQDLSQLSRPPISIKPWADLRFPPCGSAPPTTQAAMYVWVCVYRPLCSHGSAGLAVSRYHAVLIPIARYCVLIPGSVNPPVLFFKTVFIIWGPLYFHIHFVIRLTI